MFDFEDWDDPDGDGKMDQVKDAADSSLRNVNEKEIVPEAARSRPGQDLREDGGECTSSANAANHNETEPGKTSRSPHDSAGERKHGDIHAMSETGTTEASKSNHNLDEVDDHESGLPCMFASLSNASGYSDGGPLVDDLRWICPACDEPNRSERLQCNNCGSERHANGVCQKGDQVGNSSTAAMGDVLSPGVRQLDGSYMNHRTSDHSIDSEIACVRALLLESKVQHASELIGKLLKQEVSKLESFELRKLNLEAMLHPDWGRTPSAAGPASKVSQLAEGLLQEQPTDSSLPALLGRALCLEGRRKDADAVWERAATKEKHDGGTRLLLRSLAVAEAEKKTGNLAFKEAKWEDACQAYTRALEADAIRVDRELAAVVLGNRSAARRKLGMFQSAFDDAEESVRLAFTYVRARFRRALACMELGKYSEALQDLNKVKQQEPSTAGLNDWLLHAQHWNSKKQVNHYSALEASMDATAEELKKAHKRVILKWHPDKATASGASKEECETRFLAAQQAFEFLSDEKRREQYDFGGPRPAAPSPTPAAAGTSNARYGPMPRNLVAQGWGPMAQGDGRTTCLLCGDECNSVSEKKWHMFGEGHNGGFYA
eukprot:TRINITY_DN102028_c0_g1_i1.p1 TRINITY_DN102028_c0_g1~~TRINITY_DN102028_c0_g1_i1.p1  ORF type:complete len:604 (-),score=120.97 TRINITY_DN102028_c0_g1_i1:27-1838(-)